MVFTLWLLSVVAAFVGGVLVGRKRAIADAVGKIGDEAEKVLH